MSDANCINCGKPLPAESGVPAAFCSYCGAGQSGGPQVPAGAAPAKFGLGAIVLTSLITSIVVLAVAGSGIYLLMLTGNRTGEVGGTDPGQSKKGMPDPKATRAKQPSTVAASEITRVVWSRWRHEGPVSGGGRVVSSSLAFSSDLTATKTESTNYDADDAKDKTTQFTGRIDRGHFDKLSQILVENDFLNEPDGKDRITESEQSLIITYSSGEKKILLNNTGAKNTPEVEHILTTVMALDAFVTWADVK
jgi:hypothetical protein